MSRHQWYDRILQLASGVYPAIAFYALLVHVATFFTIVSPGVVVPAVVLLIALAGLLQLTHGAHRWELGGPAVIRVALLVYFVGAMYWLYRSTDGASYHQRDGHYYAVSVDRKPLGAVSREEFEQHENRVARVFSSGLFVAACVSAMTVRRVAAGSRPTLLR